MTSQRLVSRARASARRTARSLRAAEAARAAIERLFEFRASPEFKRSRATQSSLTAASLFQSVVLLTFMKSPTLSGGYLGGLPGPRQLGKHSTSASKSGMAKNGTE